MIGALDVLLWLAMAACVVAPLFALKHRVAAVWMSLLAVAAVALAIAAPLVLARVVGL